ncbi:peptidyl-prolyl cis-trans isomerase 1 [Leguminivora glycinivorella]|uniref:peptidyl-prolyl cis-trans isomerase 1 n=1 Tax=Leguminivora glycinivorella TaxID=1035111 RepID=UPI00200BBA07|nr:peptidyl-prolyl cis-trans isomerase 1 [Leguminivora glycinivorella]
MDVVEESVGQSVLSEEMLINVNDGTHCISSAADEIPTQNGVAETGAMANSDLVAMAETTVQDQDQIQVDSTTDHMHEPADTNKISGAISTETVVSTEPSAEAVPLTTEGDNQLTTENQADLIAIMPDLASKIPEEISELLVGQSEEIIEEVIPQAEGSTAEMNVESSDQVTFKTEILVERNENDANEIDNKNAGQTDELDASKSMLSALSDVLHSDNMENNNGSVREEVLNKEELLSILEGSVEQTNEQYSKIIPDDHKKVKTMEAQLALQQLTRLKTKRNARTPSRKKYEKRLSQNSGEAKSNKGETLADENEMNSEAPKPKKITKVSGTSKSPIVTASDSKIIKKEKKSLEDKQQSIGTDTKTKKNRHTDSEITMNDPKSVTKTKRSRKLVDTVLNSENPIETRVKKDNHNASANNMGVDEDDDTETDANKSSSVKDKIVNDLVRDWEDDEPTKDDADEKLLEESQGLIKSAEVLTTTIETVAESDRIDGSSIDSSTSDGTATNKTADDGQPQRRLGRVIKKKVIFDPDNPDTFTKGKVPAKPKEASSDKEQPSPKKIKTEIQQRPKSKSPTGKMHWKKPPPKASKTNKRLSEVDKLLMDEGAVNMIYQLTPEAPKGKKNMRTKAEFIKKIQSSTPDGKEMKFRERKKECIKEEAEAKKIAGGKQRGSLSSSIKSTGEDFETHSADDSIIYRRHSSSSYSSNCMSPLRITDQDSSAIQDSSRFSRQMSDSRNLSNADEESIEQKSELFMSDSNVASPSEVINKTDCLSIKQKLNSKLQNVLNKRKRENTKTDKPAKQKRVAPKYDENAVKNEEQQQLSKLKNLTVKFENNLAEIYVKRKEGRYTVETLKDLELALAYVNNKEDIAVTLLSSECGTLCSSIDLSPLLNQDDEVKTTNAVIFAETIRTLLSTVEQHNKLLCLGVSGACSGVGLALAALADVAVAGERASFAVGSLLLGSAAFTAHGRLQKHTVDNLVVFGRRLSAEEALAGGLVSRVVWPDRFPDTLRSIATHIATQPSRTIMVKKQLLTLNRSNKTFQSSLEMERDLLVDYWTSEEGTEAIRASLDAA